MEMIYKVYLIMNYIIKWYKVNRIKKNNCIDKTGGIYASNIK